MSTTKEKFAQLQERAGEFRQQHIVSPGQELRFPEAATVGDEIWQGDLRITFIGSELKLGKGRNQNTVSSSGRDYRKSETVELKLVPGGEDGAKHHLDSAEGVTMWNPAFRDELNGPVIQVTKERRIVHTGAGKHGTVVLPPGCYEIGYQRVAAPDSSEFFSRSLD